MNPAKSGRILPWKILAVLAVPAVMGFAGIGGQEGPWRLVFPPSERTDAGMAYDAGQKRMILFGGFTDGRACQDTWIFQNGIWGRFYGQASSPCPSARGRFAVCYNKAKGETMVFGGSAYGLLLDDLWLFKNGWAKAAATAGPSAREGAAMAFNSQSGAVVLFGGRSAAGLENDTWKYSNGGWTKLSVSGAPSARWKHALVYDFVRGEFVLYGGLSAAALNDTWVLKGNAWTRITGPSPGARNAHGMAFDSASRRIVLYGGAKGGILLGDTWEFKDGKWSKITGRGPSARAGVAMTYDAGGNQVMLFGGWRGTGLLQSDTWVLLNNCWAKHFPSLPDPRSGYGLAYDKSRKKVVLFGGEYGSVYSGKKVLSDTWEYGEFGWTQAAASGPSARRDPSLAYDGSAGVVVLHGGHNADYRDLTDTWTYNGLSWKHAADNGPITSGAMAYYPKLGAVVLVGADCNTYKWQSGAWVRIVTSVSPESGYGEIEQAAMVHNSCDDILVLFGGEGPDWSRMWPILYNKVWEFDGTDWSSQAKPTTSAGAGDWPRKRCGHALLYDPVRNRVVLTGGRTTCSDPNNDNEYYSYRWVLLNDTWSWDGSQWTLLTQAGPSRSGSVGVYDISGDAWEVFGGWDYGAALNLYQRTGLRQHNDLLLLKPPLPASGTFDFGISSLGLSKQVWASGDQVKANVSVKNQGSSASRQTILWLYASLDDTITDDDILLSKAALSSIAPGGAVEAKLNVSVNNLQAAVPAGFYNYDDSLYFYVGAIVDRFEQARDAALADNIRFLGKYITLKKPGSSVVRRPSKPRR